MRFDQHMHRNSAVNAKFALNRAQCLDLNLHIFGAAGLGQRDEGQAVTGAADEERLTQAALVRLEAML